MKSLILSAAFAFVSLPALADGAKSFAFGEPAPASTATRTVQVVLKDIAFEPGKLQVKAGETVRFVLINEGKLVHEFNLGDAAMHAEHQKEMAAMAGMDHGQMDHAAHGHDAANTVLVQPGQRAELTWTFRQSAPIEFACNVPGHYQAGMVGQLTIE
ncbi:copper-binding protein [Pseudomonas parafulva]|uniref:Copper-binding protein n=1 Tax=Pseudomonas parafulva TaxID=157782 RepID=A0AAI8KCG7_9PSED|nr:MULTISPECIES: cupredoxin family protein [Pseudomonas]AXO89031.1 copper-binding protein [Pseudomonas parafulva]MDV9034188.1 cupredoxin family protein [Pseudomonas sp. RAC1]